MSPSQNNEISSVLFAQPVVAGAKLGGSTPLIDLGFCLRQQSRWQGCLDFQLTDLSSSLLFSELGKLYEDAEHSRASVILWSACFSQPVPDVSLEELEFSKSGYLMKAGGQLAFLGQELCGKFHDVQDCSESIAQWLIGFSGSLMIEVLWETARTWTQCHVDNIKNIRQEDASHPPLTPTLNTDCPATQEKTLSYC